MEARELLPDYLLGQLEPEEARRLEEQLERSPELRAELEALRAALFRLPDQLPPVTPPPRTWQGIRARVRRGRGVPWPWVAGIAAGLALVFAGFGFYQGQALRALRAEQAKVAHWLSEPEGKWRAIKNAQGEGVGTMIWLEDGGCLIVMKDPAPEGKVYQAWGVGGTVAQPIPLETFRGRVVTLRLPSPAVALAISEEPGGGSQTPTDIRALPKL
ncbi:Anti-sigma-K factor rskA [Calidithermus terrae]|uniref:Regulator of SigK n=1 Tax=Calidithermus terrae TaxID=1408545 RepID=A0A399F3J0_9DEIN|nr:anti-sigma factor [Calidithermus terrae]RIH90663.1 Anti-sigma-K factor rskA [Calidithermus terrae]